MSTPESKSSGYDVIVVGAGPAGLSAAMNVANRKRTVAVFDALRPFSKTRRAAQIPNYPGFTFTTGEELAESFLEHLQRFEVTLLKERVTRILPGEDELMVSTDRDNYHAQAIILAPGVYRGSTLEGEDDLVGMGVSYCVNCDGRLYAGRKVAFVSYAQEGEEEAAALAEDMGCQVKFIPLYEGAYELPAEVEVLPRQRPDRLYREGMKVHVVLPDRELVVDGVFIFRESVSPSTLVDGLDFEGRHIKVNRKMETGIPGIFAAGDSVGEPYQIAKAVGEGQVAALSAVRFARSREGGRPEEPYAIKAEDRANLSRILGKLEEPVSLLHVTQLPDSEMSSLACHECEEARRLLSEFAGLSPKLELELLDFLQDHERAEDLGVERIPATLLGTAGDKHPRVRFYGVPAGYEFGAFLDDVMDLSRGELRLSEQTREGLTALTEPVHLEVLVTPTCPNCPGVVRLVHRFAMASPQVTADMIAATAFPEVAQRYQVSTVPTLVVNGQVAPPGPLSEERLLQLISEGP